MSKGVGLIPKKGIDIPFESPSAFDKSPQGKKNYLEALKKFDAKRKPLRQSPRKLPDQLKQYKT
jgi:hypothetical protein